MATAFDTPAQYERDLRSINKEWKRGKDYNTKWSNGTRPLPNVRYDLLDLDEGQKVRPRRKASEEAHPIKEKHNNMNKFHRSHPDLPLGRVRSKMSAQHELDEVAKGSRSILELLPTSPHKQSVSDPFVYSFDRTDSPGQPLALDVFVKAANGGRATEKFVEKEYEILDGNGDALKGRKARQNLRKSGSPRSGGQAVEEGIEVEDGFELV